MRSLVIALVAAATVSVAAAVAQDSHSSISVGSANARRGETVYGALHVARGVDAGYDIPVAVVHGARPGKVVAFVSGAHGTEYASVVALTKLISQIDPGKLSGTAIVVPLLNVASFEKMTPHVNPIDGKGMNSVYPGNPNGTQTERALAAVASQVVEPADVVVDLHGGDLDEDLRPYSYWTRTGDQSQDDASRMLVNAFGLDHVILRDIDPASAASARSLGGYALSRGKVALVAEAGRSGLVLPADVDALTNGCLNVLAALKLVDLPTRPVAKPVKTVWVTAGTRVQVEKAGMFFASAARDSIVKEGDLLGFETDYLGRRIADIRSPVGGLITFIRGVPSATVGATLATVNPILTEPPPYKRP